ncbi:MAG TPA: DUF2891 domain-containing protein [Pseudonocardiaceae bacterium]|jgi:hypothetical protein|nr:DUF2891 domain-containing protein [Pseudonocardiaceae bacterium]
MDDSDANRLLTTAVANVQRDYPVHWTHFIHSAEELVPQRTRHPVFAGSYDWHSCVHQTWLIVRLLRLRPDLPDATEAAAVLDRLVTVEGVATEAEFFRGPNGAHWERPYGWAWLLMLDAELRGWAASDPTTNAASWAKNLSPLVEILRERWLIGLTDPMPTRVGTHTNSAFALGLVLDAARASGDHEVADACVATAVRWFAGDRNYGGYEPDASDFLSPALVEADLMRRVLDPGEFAAWFDGFLPDLDGPRWTTLREPIPVHDPADPYGSHLSGLALSRAWCWASIGAALPVGHRHTELARRAADVHRAAGWRYVFGYGYAAEHWLGTFASYLSLGALTS